MHVTEGESMELACYQVKDVAYNYVTMWKDGIGDNATPMSQDVFRIVFFDWFFPRDIREDRVEAYMNLRLGSISVKEYYLKLTQQAKYAPESLPNSRAHMSNFYQSV